MLGQFFSALGGAVGDAYGGGMFSTIGRFAGRSLGNYLEQSSVEVEEFYRHRKHLNNLYIECNTEGKVIPIVFGYTKVQGQMIWALPLKEITQDATSIKHVRSTDIERAVYHDTSYSYFASFALGICEGEITNISRVWAGGNIVDISQYKCRIYKGGMGQMPDILIESEQGVGKTPAFRGLTYIVFEDLPLEEFDNRVPHFSFEVQRKCSSSCVEDLVRNMIMIPGSGEFVYDTIIQQKITKSDDVVLMKTNINSHNHKNIADSIFSLDQLQNTCPNLEWLAPVVCWFGDSLDASQCIIQPKVEFNDSASFTSEEWRIAGYTRNTATVVSRDENHNPHYGGSVNDASILRYLDEIKRRNLKIMFYPMFFLDIPQKPWRGHITGNPADIARFFNKPDGYKNFILHYARLVQGKVDAFVIGSELIGLTKINVAGQFPAVDELIDLAQKVKAILGSEVKVTYAADWSEYHHTDGGWYNLDPLWASDAIDIIGLDAYFPITDSLSSTIPIESMDRGWSSGEGYDFYRAGDKKKPLDAIWAWKNIEYWWSNAHTNPDGKATSWQPKSKKIWFTEFGFPSIDKSSNQPNVFYDPKCSDGGVPQHSTGQIDFAIQRKAIKTSLEHFQNSEFVEEMFLWTWDSRPYPAWPHGNHWRDGRLWSRGHWVNNKFGTATLGSILIELCAKAGISHEYVDISSVDEVVGGLILDQHSSIWDVINMLRCAYFFDVVIGKTGGIKFVKRSTAIALPIPATDFIKRNDYSFLFCSQIAEASMLSRVLLSFTEQLEYRKKAYYKNVESVSYQPTQFLALPITMLAVEAEVIADTLIALSRKERVVIKFTLPITYMYLEPTDVLKVNDDLIRITDIVSKGLALEITGISC